MTPIPLHEPSPESPQGGLLAPSAAREQLTRLRHTAMNCDFELWISEPDRSLARSAGQAAFAEIDRLEALLSRFRPTSDVAQLAAARPGEWQRVSAELAECLRIAHVVYQISGGLFDPTFRTAGSSGLSAASATSGAALWFRDVLAVDVRAARVLAGAAGVQVDLGAVGKGFALDAATEVLKSWGVGAALLQSGGSSALALLNVDANQPDWRVELRDPADPQRACGACALADGEALSGSGQRVRGAHIVSPRDGAPAVALAAWALARGAALSDALSTALMLAPPRDLECVTGHSAALGCRVVWREVDGRLQEYACGRLGMPEEHS